jgi:hypothetical protein
VRCALKPDGAAAWRRLPFGGEGNHAMQSSESPFPCHWWGTGLEDAGLEDVRPYVGTYGRYEFNRLPPLPFKMRGDFAWLADAPEFHEHIPEFLQHIVERQAAEFIQTLASLRESVVRLGLQLPESFTKFMETPALQARIRSNTGCFFNLCSEAVQSPIGGGYLVRFLADSQGCIFWYLYMTADGSDHAVVSSPGFYGTEDEDWDEPPDPGEIVFSAESFEAFMCRFWLENEIWFAAHEETPMPDACQEYIEQYRRKTN